MTNPVRDCMAPLLGTPEAEYDEYIHKAELAGQFRDPDPVIIVTPPVETVIVKTEYRPVYVKDSSEQAELDELRRRASGTNSRHDADRFSGGRF